MTAVLYHDVETPAPRLQTTTPSPKRRRRPAIDFGGDPLVDASARLLSIPLRHVYAVLWRVGVVEVTA